MTALILWRHGRTGWNAQRRIQGHADVDLDEVGVAQAADAAIRIAALDPTAIISSDLRRAANTAAPLAELTGLPVKFDPRLRERFFGPWQGLTEVELRGPASEGVREWANEGLDLPDIEPMDELAKRVRPAARRDRRGRRRYVVVVTHGGSARAGCGALLGWPAEVVADAAAACTTAIAASSSTASPEGGIWRSQSP